jgi:PKD repeat protein
MTYNTNFAPNETREGYFILTATNATHPNVGMTKGYSIFYEGTSTTAGAATAATIQETTTATPSGSLPRPPAAVRQVFDSFELIAAQEVIEDMLAAQSEQAQEVEEPTNPLTVDITSSDTEGGEAAAPATIEFEADISGGIEPYTISWNFGDDGSSEESDGDDVVDHTFEEAGSYDVGLTVTDSIGQSASDSMEITVEEAPEEEVEEEAPAADEVVEEVEEEETITPPANETITIEEPAEEIEEEAPEEEAPEEEVEEEEAPEEEAPAADEVVEEVEPDLDDVDNNSGSDDLLDVDDFLDDLFDRLGLR